MTFTLATVRALASTYEVEVALERPVPMTDGMRPTLRVGTQRSSRSRYVDGQLDRLVFTFAAGQFATLSASEPVVLELGLLHSAAGPGAPRLSMSQLRGEG